MGPRQHFVMEKNDFCLWSDLPTLPGLESAHYLQLCELGEFSLTSLHLIKKNYGEDNFSNLQGYGGELDFQQVKCLGTVPGTQHTLSIKLLL